ncbi:MAG: hypothetical protein QOJ93_2684, partial [Actinomycetota bacterium]|nr:hypothetical protein [Actinomycetota bacterium]
CGRTLGQRPKGLEKLIQAHGGQR